MLYFKFMEHKREWLLLYRAEPNVRHPESDHQKEGFVSFLVWSPVVQTEVHGRHMELLNPSVHGGSLMASLCVWCLSFLFQGRAGPRG